jgi:Spy/CpxP family protein refolding chaperone
MKKQMTLTGALLFCLMIVFQGYSHAQVKDSSSARQKGRWSAAGRADKISDKLYRELNLTHQQDEQIYAINEDIIRRRDAIKANKTLPAKDRMQQLKALNEERSQRFKTVLTPTQYKKWNDWEMKKREQLEAKMDKRQERKMAKQDR